MKKCFIRSKITTIITQTIQLLPENRKEINQGIFIFFFLSFILSLLQIIVFFIILRATPARKKAKIQDSEEDDDEGFSSDSEEYSGKIGKETKKAKPKRASAPRSKKPVSSFDPSPLKRGASGPIISDPAERQQKYLNFLATITSHKNAEPFMYVFFFFFPFFFLLFILE